MTADSTAPNPPQDDAPKDIESLVPLLTLANKLGFVYGSDDISMLLYTLIRRERPRRIVELGTGLGVSTFWMAQALKEVGAGQIWTVDDGSHWAPEGKLQRAIAYLQDQAPFDRLPAAALDYPGYIRQTGELLGLTEQIKFSNTRVDLADEDVLAKCDYPFQGQQIDLIFADINRAPATILNVFFHFLPMMAESGSIFIDSASTSQTGFLFLEQLVAQLNQSKVPRRFLATQNPQRQRALMNQVAIRRFTLMHLVERKPRDQNSTAWIKVEPVDYLPHPTARMKQ
jgi:predicted O-methyltransferase YrrM